MGKATKIDANTWHYRGFTIVRNYMSPHGTGRVCTTQQGVRVTPYSRTGFSYIDGDWNRSVAAAVENVDYYYRLYAAGGLSRQGRELVERAMRIACERNEPTDCPDGNGCRHGIDS